MPCALARTRQFVARGAREHWMWRLLRVAEQEGQILTCERLRNRTIGLDNGPRKCGFPLGQRADLLLDRADRDHAIGRDRTRLPDAMGTIDRLAFDGGIPPRVVEHD